MKNKLLILFLAFSLIGFMVKLPLAFSHHDKELHMLFYFTAALLLNIAYPRRELIISAGLIFFGIAIECLQEYSNKIALRLTNRPIHGNFDINDIKANMTGIALAMAFYLVVKTVIILKKAYENI